MLYSTSTNSEATRERLLSYVRHSRRAYVGIKVAALLLVLEGQRPGWICETLGMSRKTLNVLMHRVNEQGLTALEPFKKPGSPARLTLKIRQALQDHLEKSPLEFGLNRVQWDGPTLAVHLKRQFGITLKVRQAQAWMHQLGYRLKGASYSYLQARKEGTKRFRRALKKTAGPGPQGNREGLVSCLEDLYRRLKGYAIWLYVEYLPCYRPGLNLQERIWRRVRCESGH